MEIFNSILYQIPEYKTLVSCIKGNRFPFAITGLSEVHKANILSCLCMKKMNNGQSDEAKHIAIITPNETYAMEMRDDLASFGIDACVFPVRDFCFRNFEKESREYEHERLKILSKIINKDFEALLIPVEAAIFKLIPPGAFKAHCFTLEKGQEIELEGIKRKLINSGYEQYDRVDGTGQFSIRGGIIDFFSPQANSPVRIELFGDEIDSICEFDKETQRRIKFLNEATAIPAREVLLGDKDDLINKLKKTSNLLKEKNSKAYEILSEEMQKLSLGLNISSLDKFINLIYKEEKQGKNLIFSYLDYISKEMPIFISESSKVKETLSAIELKWKEDIVSYFYDGTLFDGLGDYIENEDSIKNIFLSKKFAYMDLFPRSDYGCKLDKVIDFKAKTLPLWKGDVESLIGEIKSIINEGGSALIAAGNEKFAKLLAEDLESYGINAKYLTNCEWISKGEVVITNKTFSSGFRYENSSISVISRGSKYRPKKKAKKVNKNKIFDLSDLTEGSYVVHAEHGIGIFAGVHRIDMSGIVKDYIKVVYDKGDVLYVPVTQMDMVSKYIGSKEDIKIKLNRLGSSAWKKTKKRVKSEVKDIAKDLIKLYSERMNTPGFAFLEDDEFQKDFDSRFEYEETEDQLRSINEIKKDMQKKSPMDRLLCGDVGFGKTEVALRAAFKCLENGKQCAMLTPTTVLAWQHFHTALERFEGFPFKIELLSRFRTQKQQKEIIKGIKNGSIEFVIGTHRLLQKDVNFKDLGLVIIDEEQRFGVAHKERFKSLAKNVDVLTLSATPIPRTLNMAMSGLRDMSTLNEAPQDRLPVQTYVMEYNKGVILEAIRREIRRGGQVYYLHNRIDSIEKIKNDISLNIPEAVVEIAHGQMSENELSGVWEKLINKEINVLVCTTIIETGVDVPNVNTLIIENADTMGLSQLHQLRGRVGRSSRRAYAYFTFKKDKILSEIAQKRLSAIKDFTEFGSGFKIAMRDLELKKRKRRNSKQP